MREQIRKELTRIANIYTTGRYKVADGEDELYFYNDTNNVGFISSSCLKSVIEGMDTLDARVCVSTRVIKGETKIVLVIWYD